MKKTSRNEMMRSCSGMMLVTLISIAQLMMPSGCSKYCAILQGKIIFHGNICTYRIILYTMHCLTGSQCKSSRKIEVMCSKRLSFVIR